MDAPEHWLPVVGYEGLYEVSDHGRINSLPRRTTRGGIMKLPPDKLGRLEVNLTLNGKQKTRRVHQLVMEAFAGPPEPGQEIRHLDGNPANNRWAPGSTEEEVRAAGGNLFYGTHAENMQDMLLHGTNYWANMTHCLKCGRELSEENTYWYGDPPRRTCLYCLRARNRERARAKHVPADPSATCKHCGKTFKREPGEAARKFCSQECINAGGWYARRKPQVPAADLSPEEREHRNALNRERMRRSRRKAAEKLRVA